MKRIAALMLAACMLTLAGCLSTPAAEPSGPPAAGGTAAGGKTDAPESNVYLNGTAYDVTLTVNGMPFRGTLARQDASSGWRLKVEGAGTEESPLGGVPLTRAWEVSLDLEKEGLTANPNGIYTGKASVSLRYDVAPLDHAAFELVLDERGDGEDFDHKKIKGWFSHDEYKPSELAQLWESSRFTLCVSGLGQERASLAKTLAHTLSYLPQQPTLRLSHRLYYDMPQEAERYVYSMEGNIGEQAVLIRLAEYKGKETKTLPAEPVLRIDLSPALDALAKADILLEISGR